MSLSKTSIITTADGSHSLYLEEQDEHYHSIHGAVQESKHVFIEAGLKTSLQDPLYILEMGFGTGLNVLLTLLENSQKQIHFTTVEAFPIESEMALSLNYKELSPIFEQLHSCAWEEEFRLTDKFTLLKIKGEMQDIFLKHKYGLVYYDAFSPRVQPELWTEELFRKLYMNMNEGGILVTYCSKGDVQRNLKKAGFTIEKLKGPPGKREMIRAKKVGSRVEE